MIVLTCGFSNRLECSFTQSSVSDARDGPSLPTLFDSSIYMMELIGPSMPLTATQIITRLIIYQNVHFIHSCERFHHNPMALMVW